MRIKTDEKVTMHTTSNLNKSKAISLETNREINITDIEIRNIGQTTFSRYSFMLK